MTHESIILLWPSIAQFGRDIGVKRGTALAMRRLDSIPAWYWKAVIAAARRRHLSGITYDALATAAARKRSAAA